MSLSGILKKIDKENLHHAYLLEGDRDEILSFLFSFLKDIGIKTTENPDFYNLKFDSFKIENARELKEMVLNKSFSDEKKIFLISANFFLLEAQNALLKIFEEPNQDTHFFVILPDKSILKKTLLSRFFILSQKNEGETDKAKNTEAEKFIETGISERQEIIKKMIARFKNEEEENTENSLKNEARKFLNEIEKNLYQRKKEKKISPVDARILFEHLFKARNFISQPGAPVKNILESVAFILPK